MGKRRGESASERAYRELEGRSAGIRAEKRALRRNTLTGREIASLRPESEGWEKWVDSFFSELATLKRNKIHSADQISHYFGKKGTRTIGGQSLSPRLNALLRAKGRERLLALRPSDSGISEFVYRGGDIAFDLKLNHKERPGD